MAQDFANGQRRNRTPRSEPRRARRQPAAFHWGSFGAGVALGIACTLAGALLPEWWGVPAIKSPITPPAAGDPAPITRFEFFDRLPNEKMSSRAKTGDVLPSAPVNGASEFLLQAGSFTDKEDAERLRTTLSQSGWDTETATVTLSSGAIRHRVIVGPFSSSRDTQRAITELRKQDVDALVLARKPVAG
ncbi:MAG: SPOR domain-containing protein [Proteobacteria bacterium]|jgi:cell division protein FtsN|nr:SPOR domain-containing protein [Pseudomonadota bacterium]